MKTVNELFSVSSGHSLQLNRLKRVSPEEGIPFVSRKMGDNGIAAYVHSIPDVEPNPSGDLTCALSGNGVLSAFIQDRPYYTAYHVACLTPKEAMTRAQKLYYCLCIGVNRYRYGWGRQANRSLKNILLPDLAEIPEWIEERYLTVDFQGKDAPATVRPCPLLLTETWKPFCLSSLFTLKKGKRLTKANMRPGTTPFIAALDGNNGLRQFISRLPIHEGNTITVNYNGNGVAEAFYQSIAYWCSDDVNALYPKFKLTPAIAMFLNTIIRLEKYRFSFGRKWHLERMQEAEIYLPAQQSGEPDWDFMERFIKSRPFSSQI